MLAVIIALITFLPSQTKLYECHDGKAPSQFNACQVIHFDVLGRFP